MFGVETAKNLYFGIEAPSLGDGLIDLLEGFMEDHPDTRLIIVDTLQKVRGNNEGHTYSSDYQDICQLKHFTDSRNLCLMIVHHTREQQSEDRFDTISGTNGLMRLFQTMPAASVPTTTVTTPEPALEEQPEEDWSAADDFMSGF